MFTLILILLLVAALFGVLGAVLKVALILVMALVLAFVVIAWGTWWWLKRRVRAWQVEVDRQRLEADRRRRAIDVRHVTNEADGERQPIREFSDGEGPGPSSGRPAD